MNLQHAHLRMFVATITAVTLLLTSVSAAFAASPSWTELDPSPAPSGRHQHEMASVGEDYVMLFGGDTSSGLSNETWVFDRVAETWTLKSPTSSPSARRFSAMAHLEGDQVLLFGGRSDAVQYLGDTWVYDLGDNTWTQLSPTTSPPGRQLHAMASLGNGKVLLFGGVSASGDLGDTWIYDAGQATWAAQSPTSSPSARREHAMAPIDEGRALLFGGSGDAVFDDTWLFEVASGWTLLSPATKPPKRLMHEMARVSGDRALLVGGFADASRLDDAWIFDPDTLAWTEQTLSPRPAARRYHAMAAIGADDVLLHGGDPTPLFNDETWLFDPTPRLEPTTDTDLFCVGEDTTVEIELHNVEDLYGYMLKVNYDDSLVSATGAFVDSFFDVNDNGSIPPTWDGTCAAGDCAFAKSELYPEPAVSGSGTIAQVTFTGLAAGTFDVTITENVLSDVDGSTIPHEIASLPLTVCGWASAYGTVSLQGRAQPQGTAGGDPPGEVTADDGFFGPYTSAIDPVTGAWSIDDIRVMPGGTLYTFDAAHSLYLGNQTTHTLNPLEDWDAGSTRLLGGDANNDGTDDIGDLACIGGAFGGAPVVCGTTGSSDINWDGTTNIQDLAIAGGNYTKSTPQPW